MADGGPFAALALASGGNLVPPSDVVEVALVPEPEDPEWLKQALIFAMMAVCCIWLALRRR